ncbi:DUF4846 domain-containing protein [Tenacibaculum piscium]|uniref:DUF4846 domain-containing protein n=1 Tax=Tenacibaculum piscium TaxID=1458515 RepID=UPI001F20323D|nr:DUF4846 domain-containing protein [Tenacibaculum piscium]
MTRIIKKKGKNYGKSGCETEINSESYIPAQSIHVLKSSNSKSSPWFKIAKQGAVSSERYYFNNPNIRRF